MSQTPSSPSATPASSKELAHLSMPLGQNAPINGSLPPSDESVLSWHDAMARAEEGVNPAAPLGSSNENPITSAAGPLAQKPNDGTAGEWSPMNPRGVTANGAEGAGSMNTGVGTRTAVEGSAEALPGSGQPSEWAGGLGDGMASMSPEALLQLKRERLAIGLEPGSMPGLISGEQGTVTGDALGMPTEVCLAQAVSLLLPQGIGVHALPESERAVVDGMTVGELVVERKVEGERSDTHAEEAGAQVAAQQAHLAEINTPASLPLETIQSS